ncbi:MAG: exodeoxyribonuclease VII large subunit [Bacillota bacterium]
MAHKIYTVSELNKYINQIFKSDEILADLYIKGEISNFYHHNSGHMYFTIKDEKSAVKAVMFKSRNKNLKYELKDGLEVTAHGSIGVYEPRGQYQFYVDDINPKGKGSLYLAYEQLKEKLEKEGLFAEEEKSDIPVIPHKIGVVTSPTGAAIRDILSVVKRRFENVSLLIVPSLVQGDRAASQIVSAINYLNNREDIDLIIVSRGGGSIEQLWPFNEEKVARAIFDSKIPVISGVGHETDFSISDFVADLRAPTPSAAAELAISNKVDLENKLENLSNRLEKALEIKIKNRKEKLNSIAEKQVFKKPEKLFSDKIQKLDNLSLKLGWNIKKNLNEAKKEFNLLNSKLDSLSPLKTIKRGYSVLTDVNNNIIRSTDEIDKGDYIFNILKDGKIKSEVINKEGENLE